jgi:hypothetical protein
MGMNLRMNLRMNVRIASQKCVYAHCTSEVIFYNTLHSSVGRQFKTFKIKYFGLKILSKWREKWDESTGVRPKKRKPLIPKLSRIKCTASFIIWAICQQIIQFRHFAWLSKTMSKTINRLNTVVSCLVIHLTSVYRYNFSSVSTISYAESNGGIFILIAPLIRQYKYKYKTNVLRVIWCQQYNFAWFSKVINR